MKHATHPSKRIFSLLLALLLTLTLLPTAALTADAATPTTVYYKNTNNWSTVHAYFFANNQPVGKSWPGAEMTSGNSFWSIDVPSGAEYVIFNNGSGSQTADLLLPTDGKAYYNNGAWSADGSEAGTVTTTYTVAGSAGLCGSNWNVGAAANDMTLSGSVYTKTYTNVAAGTYEFKVAKDHSWDVSYGSNGGSDNCTVTVSEDGSTVTITFNPDSKAISATVTAPATDPDPTPAATYTIAGSDGLCGTAWDVSNTANDMTLSGSVYTKTYTNVAAGSYEFKVAKDHKWDESWGKDGSNYPLTVAEDGSTVTITFNADTKAITVDVATPLYMIVNGKQVAVTAGANVLETLGTDSTWYLLEDGKRTELFDNAVFPDTTASYSNLAVSLEGCKSTSSSCYVCTGETLTAVHNAVGDVTYQWYAGTTAISGATGSTYVVEDAYVGKKIGVTVTASYDTVTNTTYPANKKIPTVLAPATITITADNATVTLNGEAKSTAVLKYTDEEGLVFALTAGEGYYLPASVSYIRDTDTKAKTLKSGATSYGIHYDADTGELSFTTGSTTNGDIAVTVTALKAATKVTYTDAEGEKSIYVGTLANAASKVAALSADGATNITVQLLEDITVTASKEAATFTAGSCTLDLNGHTIDITYKYANPITVNSGASLTIVDTASGGTISNENTSTSYSAVKVNGGSLTVAGGSVSGGSNAIYASSGSSVTVSGGSVTGAERAIWCLGDGCAVSVSGGSLSTTKATYDGNVIASHGAIVVKNASSGTLNISGGTFTSADNDIALDASTVTASLTGGTFTGGITVTGTTLPEILAANYFYTVNDAIVTAEEGQTEITSGTVVVKADSVAPVITGVDNEGTYYTTQTATVTDSNLTSVTVNGEAVTVTDNAATVTLTGNTDLVYTIIATDSVGNKTTYTVTMKSLTTVLNEIVEDTKNITKDNVALSQEDDLTETQAALEEFLETYADDLTAEQTAAAEQHLTRIEDALTAIDNANAVIDAIDALKTTDAPDDKDALAAEKAYDALTDHEKELVGDTKAEKLEKILTNYKITKGNGGKWNKSSGKTLSFTVNGSLTKLLGVEVDGKTIAVSNYTVADGTTVVKLTSKYLETLSTGKHTINFVYEDGEVDGYFRVLKASSNASTGDESPIGTYLVILVVSLVLLVVLVIIAAKKFKKKS